jgi:hypothetical protein
MHTMASLFVLVKETVAACQTPEELDKFLVAYIAGAVAGHFVDSMNAPGQRAMWVQNMREKYPADFAPTATA